MIVRALALFATLVALASACGKPAWETDRPAGAQGGGEVLSDQWYTRMRDGQKAGWAHVVWTRSRYEGRPTIHDHTEFYAATTRRMGGVEDRFESRTLIDVERDPDGALLWKREVGLQGGRRTRVETRWTGRGYTVVETIEDLVQERFVPSPEPVPTDTEAFLSGRVARGEVAPGQRFRVGALNALAERVDSVELDVEEIETLALPTGPTACLRVTERVEGRSFESTWWVDLQGILRRHVFEGAELISTTEERARDVPRHGVTYSITIEADPFLPRSTDIERALIEVRLTPRRDLPLPDFPATPFSREVRRDGNTITLELSAHDTPEATVALPVTDAELRPWLRSTNLLCADAPAVRAALREAVGDEKDGRRVAVRLLDYVQRRLAKRSGPIPSPTAAEILRDGCGDCSEHNVLFVALCRAAGLPARRLSGYAQVGDVWGMHAFAEVWLGEWVGADPTTNELGTSARYIAFGWQDDPDSFPAVVSGRIQDRMRVRTVEIQDRGERIVLDDAVRTASHDPYSGLTLADAPPGWSARVRGRPGRAGIEGPGVVCHVNVYAGVGHVPIDLVRESYLPGSEQVDFGGRPAALSRFTLRGRESVTYMIPYRRRMLHVNAELTDGAAEAAIRPVLARILAPTLQ